MEQLCGYTLTGDMTNKNAGFSMWCFGIKEGREYFIKQFLTPKYPYKDTVSSPQRIERILKSAGRAFALITASCAV